MFNSVNLKQTDNETFTFTIDKDKDFDKLYEKVESSSQTVNKLANCLLYTSDAADD